MSKQLDLSDLSKLSQDDLRYALDRYLITEDAALEAGFTGTEQASEGEPQGMGPGKDPADFKATEVVAYLNGLDEDDEDQMAEFDRVIEAENDGEGRKTILKLAESE